MANSNTTRKLLTEAEVAERWDIDRKTLSNNRYAGTPIVPFVKLGGQIRYRISDIEKAETPCVA